AAAWAIGVSLLLAQRLLRATSPARRSKAPVTIPAIGLLLCFVAEALHDVSSGEFLTDQFDLWSWRLQAAALVGIGVAATGAWVSARRTRARVVDLVLEVADVVQPGSLETLLRRLLRDPELSLAYPAGSGWIDSTGRSVAPVGRPGRRLTPIRQGNE